ncbi:hypothetical protein [Gulosibacter sp. 10]|uniref:hypothetical protein n=1 Tax=Gulosibacter sp. 10 TaxID=1255570 RepID=UPI00097EA80E|nr:hypothetical protein [Gulosibacter sp. 10]SJM54115.1 narrowly conserved hypothetical protein [Gulosibacter sp. 10]
MNSTPQPPSPEDQGAPAPQSHGSSSQQQYDGAYPQQPSGQQGFAGAATAGTAGQQPVQPQYGQPQYGQPQYGQPQYGQPQYGQPQYGQPQYGQPQYGQPQYGQPQYGQPASGFGAQQQRPMSRGQQIKAWFGAAILVFIGLVVIVVGVSAFFAEVEVSYPQADVCGTYFAPAEITGDGSHDLGMRQTACDKALDSHAMQALIQIGIGLALIALSVLLSWRLVRMGRRAKAARHA